MTKPLLLSPDRLFSPVEHVRSIARRLYGEVAQLPIISPHGHTDPAWFASNDCFADATELLIKPDHYLLRMLYSQGIDLQQLGIGENAAADNRAIWRLFAQHYYLYRGTPSRVWLDTVFAEVFGLENRLTADTADDYYDSITAALQTVQFRPRALFERFNIELLATTESPLDELEHHRAIRASDWQGKVITAYRPDPVDDPLAETFAVAADAASGDMHQYMNAVLALESVFPPQLANNETLRSRLLPQLRALQNNGALDTVRRGWGAANKLEMVH